MTDDKGPIAGTLTVGTRNSHRREIWEFLKKLCQIYKNYLISGLVKSPPSLEGAKVQFVKQ